MTTRNLDTGTSARNRELPSKPNLDQLKHQAKDLRKAHRSKNPDACGTLRRISRLSGLTDSEIFASEITLQEAQHALAKDYGFNSWAELKLYAESQARKTSQDDASSGEPQLPGTGAEELVESILLEAVKTNASDIHFEWQEGHLLARLRVDGALRNSEAQIPETLQESVLDLIKSFAKLDLNIRNQPQHGMARLKINGNPILLRISLIPYVTGESIVIRIWNDSSFKLDFNQIGFSQEQETVVRKWMSKPNGIIVFTGPVGSGKSTSLYSVISELDSRKLKIVTAEDPVWRLLKGVQQQQIDPSNGLTYPKAIRAQMNQDPDVMVVGECIDKEVLDLLINVALTGHLVFTQMHSGNGAHALRQMLHMGGDPYTLGKCIAGILSQRLVRKICNDCKEEYELKDWENASLGINAKTVLFKGKGCDKCHGSGYRGRTAVYELLELNDELRSAIVNNASIAELTEIAVKSGMVTMKQDGMAKAVQGITTIDEVTRVCG
jgi:type II secretory ATPase GspE/PulE/Tfp pilus assembly ATPase PilB-like protein